MKEVELDPMEGEQTWPTEEELTEAARHLQQQSSPPPPLPVGGQPRSRRVPRGTSDYQATWIVDQSEEEEVRPHTHCWSYSRKVELRNKTHW